MKTFEQLAAEKYPIYTGQKKNPATGKPDCPLTVRFALLARADYIKKLKEAEEKKCTVVSWWSLAINEKRMKLDIDLG